MTSLYAQSIPVLIRHMKNLSNYLNKGIEYADKQGMKHEYMLNYRLIHDMRGLPYQVQSCSNTAKFVVTRLGISEDKIFEDKETTFDELQERITQTITFLEGVDEKAMDALEAKPFIMKTTSSMGNFKFDSPHAYVAEFGMPNFYFHLTTAYCILRTLGVPLNAMDFHNGGLVKAE